MFAGKFGPHSISLNTQTAFERTNILLIVDARMQDPRIARGLILAFGNPGIFFKYIDIPLVSRQLKCYAATDDTAANNRDIYFFAHKDNLGI